MPRTAFAGGGILRRKTSLLAQVVEYENLLQAFKNSAKGKRYDWNAMEFKHNLCENLLSLEKEFLAGTYMSGGYHECYVYVPQTRLLQIAPFRDRVAQQAIYLVLNPLLDKRYIYDSYACRIGKGSIRAAERVQYWLRQIHRKPYGGKYVCGKVDAAKFFYRLDHGVIMNVLKKHVDDEAFIRIVDNIINCKHTPFGLPEGKSCTDVPREERLYDVGVPIGALMSQTVANMVMNELDQYAKHVLKIHYYARYMDDIIILAPNLDILHEWMAKIQAFMDTKLKLKCNRKTCVIPISHGIPFVGRRIWATHMRLRKSTAKHMKKSLLYIAHEYSEGRIDTDKAMQVIRSYASGLLKHVDGYDLRLWIEENIVLVRRTP